MKIRKPTAPGIVLFLLCLMYFLTYIDRVNVSTAAGSIKKEFGFSNTQLGLIFSGFAYPYALFQVIGGWVGDRLGPRKTLLICGAIWALATALTGLATGLVSLMFFRIALGFGEGATFPTATRAMQSWTPAGKRGFAQGVTHSFARLGNAVTPPIVAALMIWLSWRGAFVVLGVASLLWVIVWWLYYRDDPREHPGITPEDLGRLPPPGAPKSRAKHVPWGRLIVRILPVTFTYFCYGWTLWLFLNWLPSFFLQGYKLDIKKSALFSAGLFLELVIGPIWSVPMDIAPQYSGTASGLMNTGSAVAAIVSPLAFGYIVDLTGNWHLPFIGSVALLLIGSALAFTMHPDRKFVEKPAAEAALVTARSAG